MGANEAAEAEINAMITAMVIEQESTMKAKDRAKLEEFSKKYTVFYGMKDDEVTMIRPSGNPMTKKMGDDMLLMPDITVEFCKLVSIDSVRIFAGGLAAVATVTMHEKFTFKGTPNDDIAKHSVVLEKSGEGWKMVHSHRATGQPPAESTGK